MPRGLLLEGWSYMTEILLAILASCLKSGHRSLQSVTAVLTGWSWSRCGSSRLFQQTVSCTWKHIAAVFRDSEMEMSKHDPAQLVQKSLYCSYMSLCLLYSSSDQRKTTGLYMKGVFRAFPKPFSFYWLFWLLNWWHGLLKKNWWWTCFQMDKDRSSTVDVTFGLIFSKVTNDLFITLYTKYK